MTLEVKRAEWKPFFDSLSSELANWDTTVHVLDAAIGVQLLTDRLPFHGLILESIGGRETIGLSVGFDKDTHQTHSILWPTKVAYAERGHGPAGTLDIEDAAGTTTLITFIEPHRELMERGPSDLAGRG